MGFDDNYDWTNKEIVTVQIQIIILSQALLYGDSKYFQGKRDRFDPPSFTQNKWASMEFSYNLSSTTNIISCMVQYKEVGM